MVEGAGRWPVRRIVLVHGAGHGAWCWEHLTPELAVLGYQVQAPDLPGLGEDQTPPGAVTFDSYVTRVTGMLRSSPEPVVLVGHSLGGTTISQVAEEAPELVAKLVYLAAFLPCDGESAGDAVSATASATAGGKAGPRSGALSISRNAGEHAHEFDAALAPDFFYNRCDPDTARWAACRLRPQANAPVAARVRLSASRWGAVPKVYVQCTQDRALPPDVQRSFCDRQPGVRRRVMDSDHSPFLSNVPALAALLHEEAQAL
ncbi:MAG TPA: alpha/beta fold hydrolase [Trebonia sp.]